ncbi:MAG: hypothetical protein ACTSX9_08995 [Candidatus Njordarchaeales archaeon]
MNFRERLKYLNIVRLYSNINRLEESLRRDKIDKALVERTVQRIKNFDFLERDVSYTLLWVFPLQIFLGKFGKKIGRSVNFVRILRDALEKTIVENTRSLWSSAKKELFEVAKHFDLPLPVEDLTRGVEFIGGNKPVLLTAPHSQAPMRDEGVEELVRRVAKATGAYALISRVSRTFIDYNRKIARLTPFRRIIEKLSLEENKIRLILDIHSAPRSNGEYDVEIGVFGGLSSSRTLVVELFDKLASHGLRPILERKYIGGDIIRYHSLPPFINAIQLEFLNLVKAKKRRAAEKALIEYINSINL